MFTSPGDYLPSLEKRLFGRELLPVMGSIGAGEFLGMRTLTSRKWDYVMSYSEREQMTGLREHMILFFFIFIFRFLFLFHWLGALQPFVSSMDADRRAFGRIGFNLPKSGSTRVR